MTNRDSQLKLMASLDGELSAGEAAEIKNRLTGSHTEAETVRRIAAHQVRAGRQ